MAAILYRGRWAKWDLIFTAAYGLATTKVNAAERVTITIADETRIVGISHWKWINLIQGQVFDKSKA